MQKKKESVHHHSRAMRPELTARAYSSHQGIKTCIQRAKDVVSWRSIGKDIQEAVEECEVSAVLQYNNSKQPMPSLAIHGRPWRRVQSHLFTLNFRDHIVLSNNYSGFIEVGELQDTTSSNIILFLKQQFKYQIFSQLTMAHNLWVHHLFLKMVIQACVIFYNVW